MSEINFEDSSILESGNRLAGCRIGRASPVSIVCFTSDVLRKSCDPSENTSKNSHNNFRSVTFWSSSRLTALRSYRSRTWLGTSVFRFIAEGVDSSPVKTLSTISHVANSVPLRIVLLLSETFATLTGKLEFLKSTKVPPYQDIIWQDTLRSRRNTSPRFVNATHFV